MWFRNPFGSRPATTTRTPRRRQAPGRLAIEALDDRCVPATLSVGDVAIMEGDAGTQSAALTVRLSGPVNPPVTVNYSTANGSAVAGADFQAVSGTLTFRKGETVKTISIPVVGDVTPESTETFTVNLRTPKHAILADAQAVVTITDNDTSLSIGNAIAVEGNAGTTAFNFPVTLSTPRNVPVTVNWATADYSAGAGSDYQGASGSLTFAPGETAKEVNVLVNGDWHFESDEAFYVTLGSANNAVIANAYGMGTIRNDDVQINMGGGAGVTEGSAGTAEVKFTVTLSAPVGATVTVDYATADGTALAGEDYVAGGGTLTFAPGETSKTITVLVNGDGTLEYDENFLVSLSNSAGADVGSGSAWGSIANDDGPIVSVDDVWNWEGYYGTTTVYAFTVRLSMPSSEEVIVGYETVDGWALAGEDYAATSGSVTFAPGETEKVIYVEVFGDDYYEGDEYFSIGLTLQSGTALVQSGGGTGTIADDDYYYDGGWYYYDPYGYGYY
jgi:chitinase